MLYPVETAGSESLMENIIHHHLRHHDGESSSSSSSSSSPCSSSPRDSSSSSNINQQQLQKKTKKIKKKKSFFFRNKPIHKILGGGKSADIILWRDKRISACMLAGVTVLWFLFEWLGYHLVSFSCHFLILSMLILFLCSNLSSLLNRSPPKFQEVIVPEDLFVSFALSLRYELYQAFAIFRVIATGKDLKKFLRTVVVLWVLSVVGSWFNFLTLLYIAFVILQTVAVLYEKHESQVDTWTEKVMVEINKHYTVLEEKVRQKLAKTKQQ